MIIAFTGTPGSGKTYEAVKKLIDNLKMDRVIYTNIDGIFEDECLESIKVYTGLNDLELANKLYWISDNELDHFWTICKPGSLIILDEAQKVFSNRDWSSDKNIKFGSWCSTHRHEGYDLVIITQAAARIDSAVRALFEWNYVFRKINFFGGAVQKKYICIAYSGEDTNGQPLSRSVRTYNQKVFRCYKSYVSSDIKELSIMKHVNVLKHPVFFALPVLIAFCGYMIFFKSSLASGDMFGANAATAELTGKKADSLTETPEQMKDLGNRKFVITHNEKGVSVSYE